MKSTLLASLSLLLPALPAAWAQSAEEFFHRGAQQFISESNAVAKAEVEQGLKLHPNDPKLTKLWELLNQQQQQQQQQQQKDEKQKQEQKDKQDKQQQDQKDQQKQEQQKKDEQAKKDQQKQEQQDQQKKEQDQASKPDKKDGEEKKDPQSASRPEKGEPQEPGDGEPQQVRALRMTPQQAQLLLDAAKSEERTLPIPPDAKPRRKDRVFKDW